MGISGEREEHEDGKLMVYTETSQQPLGHAQGSWGVGEAAAKRSWEDGLGGGNLKWMSCILKNKKQPKQQETKTYIIKALSDST